MPSVTISLHDQSIALPDPLELADGQRVDTAEKWTALRRPELLELFREEVYGRAPVGRPQDLSFSVEEDGSALEGTARRKRVAIRYRGPGGEGAINLILFIPAAQAAPVPCFLLLNNRMPTMPERQEPNDFWPADAMIERGYAAAVFQNTDVVADAHDDFSSGIFPIFEAPGERAPDAWGAIAAWAWGASRVMDYLVTDPAIDAQRVALVGHSRGGKAALWAGAEDERFALVVSNESGSTGAALARGKVGERIERINTSFPHWFCANYKAYNGREEALPVDQHELLALIAPRLLYVASASEDQWADPEAEYAAAVAAGPVYALFGHQGLSGSFPAIETPRHQGQIGHHIRVGKHSMTHYDWSRFMDFADKHWD